MKDSLDRPACDLTGFTADEAARLENVLRLFERMDSGPLAGFLPALAATKCRIVKEDIACAGQYVSHNRTAGGFENRLALGPSVLADERRLFKTLAHEGIHALQNMKAAALHALPQNARTNIMLCPRDYIYAVELCERDAYAKEALADLSREAFRRKEGLPPMPFHQLGAATFQLAFALQARDVPFALHKAGRAILDEIRATPAPEELRPGDEMGESPVKDVYNYKALVSYLTILDHRADALARGRMTFTRLADVDIAAIGGAFGPNPFCEDDGTVRAELRRPAPLAPEIEALLTQLNAALGIRDENALPPFGAALKARKITPEAFLWAARLPPPPPKTLAPGPKPA